MSKIIEIGNLCKHDNIISLSYKTSPEWHNWHTFYLNTSNNKSVSLYTPSVTQWQYYNPIDKDLERQILNIIKHAREIREIADCNDMWHRAKMQDVLKYIG